MLGNLIVVEKWGWMCPGVQVSKGKFNKNIIDYLSKTL